VEQLRGHAELRSVHLSSSRSNAWAHQVLRSLPRLEQVVLLAAELQGADTLLADLAACSSLRSIRVRACC
jgi:hypothetical protein